MKDAKQKKGLLTADGILCHRLKNIDVRAIRMGRGILQELAQFINYESKSMEGMTTTARESD